MPSPEISKRVTLIKNGRVYDHDGDVDQPPVGDILIVDDAIAAIRNGLAN
jgi:dihydroorotase-like cyclic amidohydrolase